MKFIFHLTIPQINTTINEEVGDINLKHVMIQTILNKRKRASRIICRMIRNYLTTISVKRDMIMNRIKTISN
jgi:hypothetical protein